MDLRLIGLTRRYGGAVALDEVSVHVRSGDCYGFLGHNGAGKTTTMRVALGLERADVGRVIVDGFDAAAWPREARARMGGLVETPGFHGHLDGAANLVMLARLQGLDRAAARREAARLLDAVGLADVGTKRVRAYSQGMRQRLGIAQALIGSPKLVLLDEPMNGLDPEGIEETRRLLLRLTRDEGTTVLLSSHQLGEIAGLCNRIGILREGRMLVEQETSTLLATEAGRYALATDDDAQAARLLASRGITSIPNPTGGLHVALGDRRPGDVARELVAGGAELRTWSPRPPSLEEIYLRFAQGREPQIPVVASTVHVVERPGEVRAPSRPASRVVGYELRRFVSTSTVPLMLAIPAILTVGSIWSSHGELARNAADVASGALASTTNVTAFEAFGTSMQTSIPLLVLLVVGLASQSIAGEVSRGTLRSLLLRPVSRVQAASGKAAALLCAAFAAFVLVEIAGLVAAGRWFEYRDVAEILPNGATFPLPGGEATKMWPEVTRTLLSLVPVLMAFTGIGLLAGAVARTGATAMALAFGGVLFMPVLGAFGFAGWLPTSHLPLPVGERDTSVVQSFVQTTRVMSNGRDPYADLHVVVPLVWAVGTVAAAAVVLGRRSIR